MTSPAAKIAGSTASGDAARDWEAVRHTASIQYQPLVAPAPPEVPQVPGWLAALGRALEAVFGPIGRLLGLSWPVFQWVLIVLAALLVLFLLWRIVGPMLERWGERPAEGDPADWTPSGAQARALLEDADRLAAEGRFAEATHLLLRRSVEQIADARPDWLDPASTAREIAALPMLPEPGRRAFAAIAARVERAFFALRDLDGEDWAAARAAYAEFAALRLRESASP